MKKKIKLARTRAAALIAIALLAEGACASSLVIGDILSDADGQQWKFVGSWNVDDGPFWSSVPAPIVYSGQEAAAFLYGGLPSDYAISTSDSVVTHTAFMSAYGIGGTQERDESFSLDTGGPGYDTLSDYSAYVRDNSVNNNENLAFIAIPIPEPSSIFLMGLGTLGFVARRRRRD